MQRTHPRLLYIPILAGLCLLAYGSYVLGQNTRRPLASVAETPKTPAPASRRSASSSAIPEVMARSEDGQTIRAGLFSPPAPPEKPPSAVPAQPPIRPPVPILPAPEVVDPLSDYVYNAVMTANGERTAVIEHRKSKQGWLVREGDMWLNYRIISITDRQIQLLVDGQERTLTRSDTINLVPLRSDAAQSPSAPIAVKSDPLILLTEIDGLDLAIDSFRVSPQSSLSEAEIAHIKDEAFEGRITGEEAERRLQQGRNANRLNANRLNEWYNYY